MPLALVSRVISVSRMFVVAVPRRGRRTVGTLTGSLAAGSALALTPVAALAEGSAGEVIAEGSARGLERPEDWGMVMFLTGLSAVGLGLIYTLGYLYRRTRGLDWDFQKPDAPADHH